MPFYSHPFATSHLDIWKDLHYCLALLTLEGLELSKIIKQKHILPMFVVYIDNFHIYKSIFSSFSLGGEGLHPAEGAAEGDGQSGENHQTVEAAGAEPAMDRGSGV